MWETKGNDRHANVIDSTVLQVELQDVVRPLWRADVILESSTVFAGFWYTLLGAKTATEIYNRILQIQIGE